MTELNNTQDMTTPETKPKSLGAAIDEIIGALAGMEKKDQLVAINAVCTHLEIELAPPDNGHEGGASTQNTPGVAAAPDPVNTSHGHPKDIRSLKEEKNPSSAREMACIVAYYLEHLAPIAERKTSISTEDITKYFKQAGFPLPSAIPQLLKDSKTAGYFDSGDRGSYKLNPVGYNLVVHSLPKSGSGPATRNRSAGSSRAKAKPAKKKAAKR